MFKQVLVRCLFALGALVALGIAGRTDAATIRPLLLDEVIDGAAIAFHGTCVANRVERDAATNLIVTYTTFEVRDAIKGSPGTTHVIKQIGGTLPDGRSGMLVQGVPTFTVGAEYVVFLAGVSSLGFSSPVGLSQGNFAVRQGKTGKTIATGRNLRDLTANMPGAASVVDRIESADSFPMANQIGLGEFKQLARAHANRPQ